jgi:AAA domain
MNARGTWNSGANGFSNFIEGDHYDAASMDALGDPVDLRAWRTEHEPKEQPDREQLILSEWLNLEIPPRDYLLGGVMCTTSRLMLIGETGIGKTLTAMETGAGVSSGNGALGWAGQRKSRVMYLDGELPAETFKERMEMIAGRQGRDLQFYGYNRDRLGDGEMPPLNTEAGQKWFWREVEIIKPDLIQFDSIMSLLTGDLMTPEAWAPMLSVVRGLSAKRIAQMWLHHANDLGKGFGTKTREWEMDTVAVLSKIEDDDESFKWEFTKMRLRTPSNRDQYTPRIIHPCDNWRVELTTKGTPGKRGNCAEIIRSEFLNAYDRLADSVTKTSGLDGKPVLKVNAEAIRDEMKSRGFLPLDEKGHITGSGRKILWTAKTELLKTKLVEKEGLIWKP